MAVAKNIPVRVRKSERLSLEAIADLEAEYYELATADDDDAKTRVRDIVKQLRGQGQHLRCGDEPDVEVDVPPGPDGLPLRINGKPYQGWQVLPLCVWTQLCRTLDGARRQDAERFRDAGMIYDLDTIEKRARMIPQDVR